MFDCPVYITVRDRLRDLRRLVGWLERAGHQQIALLDNDSTYPPLLAYLAASPHDVHRLNQNLGSRALWDAGLVPDSRFILTDPDILPTDQCPLDAVAHLHRLMDEHQRSKVGLGLYLEDVPADMPSLGWERDLASKGREIAPGVLDSLIDTTFALYEAGADFQYEALRTRAPYLARHASWYTTEPDVEDAYYLQRAETGPTGSSWKEHLHGLHETDAHP